MKSAFYWREKEAGRASRVHKGEIDLPFSDQVVSVVKG